MHGPHRTITISVKDLAATEYGGVNLHEFEDLREAEAGRTAVVNKVMDDPNICLHHLDWRKNAQFRRAFHRAVQMSDGAVVRQNDVVDLAVKENDEDLPVDANELARVVALWQGKPGKKQKKSCFLVAGSSNRNVYPNSYLVRCLAVGALFPGYLY